jgi:hypothetical protein
MVASTATVRSAGDVVFKPLLFFCLAALLALPGCRGCSKTELPDAEQALKNRMDAALKEKEKPKPDFEPIKLTIVPQKTDDKSDIVRRMVKPGHWTAVVEETEANNFDFTGQLFAEARTEAMGPPIELPHTPYRLAVTRPAPLGKGQPKSLELLLFVPPDSNKVWLATELRNRGGSVAATPGPEPLTLMKAHQYHLVVLAQQPYRYRLMERLDSVRAPHASSLGDLDSGLHYYQVIAPPLEKPFPLPSNVLAWTSIAYLVWDDVDPSLLSPEQQQALVDWLHWGGQLIISGPKSLDQLRGQAFLGSYLPATAGEPLSITAEMLKPFSDHWTLPVNNEPGQPLAPVNPWSGVSLIPQGDADVLVDTGGPDNIPLVVERRVGRGRIVTTAFRLTQRELWDWPSFDGFLNACLLRRPPRVFSAAPYLGGLNVDWADQPQRYRDPLLVTGLRFLSRDWHEETGFAPPPPPLTADMPHDEWVPPSANQQIMTNWNWRNQIANGQQPIVLDDETELHGPGVAAWNDNSATSDVARDSLRKAAGIVIPQADFVMRILVLYLIVLVPLNWILFRSLGHVEWAWIATPIIAVGGMATVVKVAQLDIGFARSQTELAVLEAHVGYSRGHLTRYTALYTSLSTTYDANSADRSTLVLPFPSDLNFTPRPSQSIDTVTYHGDPAVQLSDFGVSSNSTSLLHSEQMIDLGGPIEFTAADNSAATSADPQAASDDSESNALSASLTNRTNFNMKRAAVLRRTLDGVFQLAWIGDLPPGRKVKLQFQRPDEDTLPAEWSYDLSAPGELGGPKLSLEPMATLVRQPKTLEPGEARLVALIEGPLAGLQIDPAASQTTRGGTLVVVNLQYPVLAAHPPQPDKNTHRDIATPRDEREFDTPPPPDDLPDSDS